MTKQFWIILAVIAVLLGGVFVISNNKKAGAPSSTSAQTVSKHIEGDGKSGVTLQEYGDYQCPICGDFFTALQQVEAKYKSEIYFQYSNLPLTQLHPNAYAAARAAEAAGLQGKYFAMHDLLYQNQTTWSTSTNAQAYFNAYAQQLNLNLDQFKKDVDSAKVNATINADISAFNKTGDPLATPTFYLDGKKLDNATLIDNTGPSVAQFSKVIDAEIAKKAHQ